MVGIEGVDGQRMRRTAIVLAILATAVLSSLGQIAPDGAAAQEVPDPETEIVVGLKQVYEGFEFPTHLTNAGDGTGRLFVSDRAGRVWIAVEDRVLETPFLDIRHLVASSEGEQGLFATVFHPAFPVDDRIFVAYTRQVDGAWTLDSFQVSEDADQVHPTTRQTLLVINQPTTLHNGGGLAFGPDDYLYAGLGDGGPSGDPEQLAQDPASLLGKILRLDVNTPSGYLVPPDNPFVGVPEAKPEIWALGLRNPWRISIDSLTGDIFVGDVGSGGWEEINVQPGGSAGGQNYGWPLMEASSCWPPDKPCDPTGLTVPAAEYSHDLGCSVTGGHVYRGTVSPNALGSYLYGDWCSGNIWTMRQDDPGSWSSTLARTTDLMITAFGTDEAGELYVADFAGGGVHQINFYEFDPALTITGTTPETIHNGALGASLTVHGEGFTESSIVQWEGRELLTIYVSDRELQALLSGEDTRYLLNFDAFRQVEITVANAGANPTVSAPYPVTVAMHAHPAFGRTWQRTDALVASHDVNRTWMWGPLPLTGRIEEIYEESPSGKRVVQYYDKSRMEFTDPNADPNAIWSVTNGLLVMELITGRMQVGEAAFVDREPSQVNVAGDQGSSTSPVYATFADHLAATDSRVAAVITERIDRNGEVTIDRSLAALGISYAFYDQVSGHSIAGPFWEFMISRGLVYIDGEEVIEDLFANPFFATGRPVTEAFWASVPVKGVTELLLLQCFERRCLTYTMDNNPGWQVEAGNVGRHYYDWRYLNR